ncbi:thioredoxin domain-containing protein [Pelodictyon phaeoclathratiforme]|jgi:nitrogenase-associated protein|uniref:Nitrogenase-associated protein n=1 Tax=Pelodictyon phaeoclathratiforme (strain DSM 5477 / BU-1) TaxID=324925 RepID=B4SD53_PELPB|nr:ArsC/Spx/MgsR family protein [Pelodictyon phaeoclathratiforme]ACF44312.1 nitrogenase-associated protein [Pelodictyon phaeoclathratiforme BU-1]MBV5289951.1 arsenate reductase family protein [Pelodictyon phaeoclathratiforme]
MATILFYEKPGCRNNNRQKAMLELSGHTLETVNLLEYAWSKEELAAYLGDKPVADCFNPAAPMIKSGELNPQSFTREEAIAMMIQQPLLIKRPLMKIGGHHLQGFDTTILKKLIHLTPPHDEEEMTTSINMSDMNSCPHDKNFSCTTQKH